MYGNANLLFIQFEAIAVTWVYSFAVTYLLFKVLDATMGLRVSPEEELVGLDLSQHGEAAYT